MTRLDDVIALINSTQSAIDQISANPSAWAGAQSLIESYQREKANLITQRDALLSSGATPTTPGPSASASCSSQCLSNYKDVVNPLYQLRKTTLSEYNTKISQRNAQYETALATLNSEYQSFLASLEASVAAITPPASCSSACTPHEIVHWLAEE